MRRLLTVALYLAIAGSALAGELAGVSMPDTTQVGDQELVLNGMGLRKKSFFKIYVAGLYLPEREQSSDAILGSDTIRHTVMAFTSGLATAKRLCNGWTEGLEKNTPGASPEVKKQFETLCGYMEDMKEGDQMVFTYVPGEGTEAIVKGESKGRFEGKEFTDALFACWIGPEPPGEAFKTGLLGG